MALPLLVDTLDPDIDACESALLAQHSDDSGAKAINNGQSRTVCVLTFGCSHNASDGEQITGQLAAAGYALTSNPDAADVLIINSCTVKGPSQDSFLSLVRKYRDEKKVLVAGCVPQADITNKTIEGLSVIGVQELDRVVEIVERTLSGEIVRAISRARLPSLTLPKVRRNKLVEIIPINLGCLGSCTYCKTIHARGRLRSYPVDDIVSRVRAAVADGVRQVWITSEDAGAYGKDIGSSLPALLRAIIAELPDDVMLRVGMANPPHILGHIDEMAAVLNHQNVFSFIHIPVQCGSDSVLSAMNREYTVADFQTVVDGLRANVEGLTVATDVICGYPTETEEDFRKTLALVERNYFPIMNISQFYPRPGTPAAKLHLLPTQEVKRRSTQLTKLFKSQRPFDEYVGRTVDVWVSGMEDGQLVGHTKNYLLTFLPLDESLLGKRVRVHIERAGKHFLRGILV